MNDSYYDYYPILPKGRDLMGDIYGSWDSTPPPAPKCECGAEKTYGINCPLSFHSAWCPKAPQKETK